MSDLRATIPELSKPNPKRVIVAISYAIKPEPEIMPYVPEHLKYMAEHEDRVFLSGPFIKPGRLVNAGLIIFDSDREEDALEFMSNEPLVKRGLRRFELKVWEIREEVKHLSTDLVSAQECERRKISRELNDEVGQVLSAIMLGLGSLRSALRFRTAPKPSGSSSWWKI